MTEPKTAAELAEQYTRAVGYAMKGGGVARYHTIPQLRPQDVAQHSYGVAWLCWALSGCVPSATLLMAALVHDVAEYSTGDMPAMTKRVLNGALDELEHSVLKQHGLGTVGLGLTLEERRILKLADILEGWRHSINEVRRGNFEMKVAATNYAGLVRAFELDGQLRTWAQPFITKLRRKYEQFCQ